MKQPPSTPLQSPSLPKRLRGGYEEDLYEPPEDDFDDDIDEPLPPEEMDTIEEASAAIAPPIDNATKYTRPAVSHTTTDSDLNLQWLDIDTISGKPLDSNPSGGRVTGATSGIVPVIRIYGVNEVGNSVAVFIHGFTAYAHFALPKGCTLNDTDENLGRIRGCVEEQLKAKLGNQGKDQACCLGVQYVSNKKSIMGYDPAHQKFLKVYVSLPNMISKLKTIMEEGLQMPGVLDGNGSEVKDMVVLAPYECNVPYVMRYMIDLDVTGASWLTLPQGKYGLRGVEERSTWCQVCFKSFCFRLLLMISLGDSLICSSLLKNTLMVYRLKQTFSTMN